MPYAAVANPLIRRTRGYQTPPREVNPLAVNPLVDRQFPYGDPVILAARRILEGRYQGQAVTPMAVSPQERILTQVRALGGVESVFWTGPHEIRVVTQPVEYTDTQSGRRYSLGRFRIILRLDVPRWGQLYIQSEDHPERPFPHPLIHRRGIACWLQWRQPLEQLLEEEDRPAIINLVLHFLFYSDPHHYLYHPDQICRPQE